MIIALASPRVATSIDDALAKIKSSIAEAAARNAAIVCFPEAYLPGLRGLDFDVPPFDAAQQERSLREVVDWSRTYQIATILSMEWLTISGRQIAAIVFDKRGELLGCQIKNQLDPSEESLYIPGHSRQIFEIDGVKFGIAICHEGFRYPETVRWAALRGARIVFHPHCTGSDQRGACPTRFASPDGPYYEKAMMCRALENTIYFASVNYAFRYQESATCIIAPSGQVVGQLPYGEDGVLVQAIGLETATGLLATRFAPERML